MGIDNRVPAYLIPSLRTLCVEVLEPLRQAMGVPILLSSGYRCPALNRAVGGQANSQHLRGEAADIRLPSVKEGKEWYAWLMNHVNLDQLIWECQGECRWIHVSCQANPERNRHQVFRLVRWPALFHEGNHLLLRLSGCRGGDGIIALGVDLTHEQDGDDALPFGNLELRVIIRLVLSIEENRR